MWMYREDMGIYDADDNVLLRGTPAAGLILFVLVPLPQALKVFGMQGVPVTQFFAATFLLAYITGVVACTLGVPRKGDETMTAKLDKDARHELVQISKWTYYVAFLVQLILWLVVAVFVFSPILLTRVTANASDIVEATSSILYTGLFGAFVIGGIYLLQYKGAGLPFIIGGVVFKFKVSQSDFTVWYTNQATSLDTTITIVTCVLVGIAIGLAGVAVMSVINMLFAWMGEIISTPIVLHKKSKLIDGSGGSNISSTELANLTQLAPTDPGQNILLTDQFGPQANTGGETEPANLQTLTATPSELPEPAVPTPVFRPLRRAISLHFTPGHTDHARLQKRPSFISEAGLLEAGLSPVVAAPTSVTPSAARTRAERHPGRKVSGTKGVSAKAKDYFWERGLAVGFAITNLIFGILYYRFLYSSEGTRKASYAEVIG